MLLRAILSGGVWNGFLLRKSKGSDIRCRFCDEPDGDGQLFCECSFALCSSSSTARVSPSVAWPMTALAGPDVFFGTVGLQATQTAQVIVPGLWLVVTLQLTI